MTGKTFFGFVSVIGLVISGMLLKSGDVLAGLGLAALNTMLLGALVAHLERAARYTLHNVLVDTGVHVADIVGRNLEAGIPLYLLTKEGRIRPVVRMFTAHFDGQQVVILEEKWVRETDGD